MGFKWKIGLDSSTNHPPIIPKSNQATLPLKWHPNEQIQYHLYNTIEVSCPLNPFCFVQKRDEPEIYSIYSWLVRPFLNGHKLRYPPFFQEPMAVIYIYIYMFSSICFRKLHWYHTIQYLHIKKKKHKFSPILVAYIDILGKPSTFSVSKLRIVGIQIRQRVSCLDVPDSHMMGATLVRWWVSS